MLEFAIRRTSSKKFEGILITFNDQIIKFNGEAAIKLERTIKDRSDATYNLFDCLNDYIAGTMDHEQQKELFNLYNKAHVIVDSGKFQDYNDDLAQLKPITDEILDFINVPKYCSFIHYSKYMKIPKDLSEAASKGDYPEQTTIRDHDYVEQVKLAFVARVIYPIVFGLQARFEVVMGSGGFSDLACGNLIKDNPWIINLPGWHKLVGYVKFAFDKRGIPTQPDSVTSVENFVDKVLFNTVFNRLCCAAIPETEEGKNIATAINASVKQHESLGGNFTQRDYPSESDDDKRSMLDKHQISEEVRSTDDTVAAEFFSFTLFDEEDNPRYKDRFKYTCQALGIQNVELVEKIYDNLSPHWDFELEDHILKLLQLVFAFEVSPFAFEAAGYDQLMAAICVAQVRLHEQGYKYLPSVIGAIKDPNGELSLPDGFSLSEEDRQFMASICEIQSRNNEGRSFNEAVQAAQSFLDKFGRGIWQSNLEYGVLDTPETYALVRPGKLFALEISVEVKNEFMALNRKVNA
jgi:hypothetical protein